MGEPGNQQADLSDTSFEAALAELEAVVRQLEEGELSLEESIALYERGQMLSRLCQERLDQAELRVEQLESSVGSGEFEMGGTLC
jgi:exodeoxyribonuclease VII small subunit